MTRVKRLGRATFSSLHNRNFRLYFIGQTISVSGTWMQRFAQAWLILGLTHNNGVALGVEAGLQFLPMLLFGAWGGVLADRFDKRRLLYATQVAAGLLALGLGCVVAFGTPTVAIVYVFSVLLGFVNVVDNPARQTFVMEMVGRKELPNAVALNSVVMNSSRVVGPAVGGIVVAAVGLAPCFFFNAASYVAVIFALWLMNAKALIPTPRVARAKGQLREGFRYVWSEPRVRTPLLMMAVIGTLAFNFTVVTSLIGVQTFGVDARGLGLLTAVMGLGAVSGGLAMASRHGVSYPRLIVLGIAMGVAILAAGAAPTLGLEFVMQFLMGFASFAFIATANTTLQLTSRPEMRGRVMALYAIAFLGSTPIGSPIIGWVCAQWGPRAGFAVGGIAAIIASVVAGISLAKHARVTKGVPAGLREDAQPVGARADRDLVEERAGVDVDRVDDSVVAAGDPQNIAVGG
jgi:MFS family permease